MTHAGLFEGRQELRILSLGFFLEIEITSAGALSGAATGRMEPHDVCHSHSVYLSA